MTHSIGNALAAMRRIGARRIVVLSALGVGDSFALAPAGQNAGHLGAAHAILKAPDCELMNPLRSLFNAS